MSRFNKAVASSKTVNLAGGTAYTHKPEMELIVSVLTTFLDNKHYESGDSRLDRTKELAGKVDDEFLAKLIVMARRDFHLRSVSHVLAGELAKKHRGDDLVKRVVEAIAERPDDLTELVSYIGKPIPKQVKRGIRHALLKYSPYQLAKYRMEGKKVKLVDLFNLAHPNPKFATKEQKAAWKKLLKGELKNDATWETKLSAAGDDEDEKADAWKELVMEEKIGYMALLKNLRNIDEQGDAKTKKKACKLIADKAAVEKSKQLPFRFYNAYEQVQNQDMREAISEALEHALANVPKFKGKTLVALDSSGSMTSGSEPAIKKGSIFAAALAKSNGADLILYDTDVKGVRYLKQTPTLMLAEKLQGEANGGGTNTPIVFGAATTMGAYDRIVIISDNESWDGGSCVTAMNKYKKATGADPYIYAIDVAGYGTKDLTGNRVFHLAGWSEKIFDFMHWIEQENGLVDFVKKIKI